MLTYIVVILITLLLMSIYVAGVLEENLYENEQIDLFAKANIIAELIPPQSDSFSNTDAKNNINRVLSGTQMRSVVVNPAYKVILDTGTDVNLTGKIFMRSIIKTSLGGGQAHTITQSEQDTNILAVTVPVKHNGEVSGAVYVFETIDSIDKMISSVKLSMIIFSALITILIGMLSFGMSYIITSPIDKVINVAKAISKGDFSQKLEVKGHDEFAQMAQTMNFMSTELENLEENRRKFVSDASHELKTPLATIKLICDSIVSTENPDPEMTKDFLGDMSDEVDRLTRIIERLLSLTKMDSQKSEAELAPVDFIVMMNAITKKLMPTAGSKNIVLYTDFSNVELEPVNLDYDKMWEAIYNIVDNAIKYSPEGGFIKVSLELENNMIVVKVEDNGPGIPEGEKDRIFERFYRLDDSRARDTGGTGLGLAIAKESVLLHGGEIGVTSTEGMGSTFVIKIPYNKA